MTSKKPKRMSTDDRRDHLLDVAARVIVTEGVAATSMEKVAIEAGVSKPLVYKYFDNRKDLLSNLLLREFPAFHMRPLEIGPDESFANVIRRTTMAFIDRYIDNGILIERLMNEPAVAHQTLRLQEKGRQHTVQVFGELFVREHGVSLKEGVLAAELFMGVTLFAAKRLARDNSRYDEIVEMVVQIIVAAISNLHMDID